ncbi:N-acetylmuramoyl-L-alanine amidase [Candidatus Avelusimicrobium fimicolum]|uniref:N-acetylmuramoyl-L-alanine amidase n=1 Tax=Candidatus Avelusimicrobium fimicolum TaxID=3416216 RepID=UPI003D09F5FE
MIQETFPMIIGEEEIPNERALLTQEDGPMMASSASVKYIVIHCSATRSTRDYTAEQLLRDHKTRGFRTVGYHFYIRRDGSVTQHRKLLEVGAHCRPWNRCSIGICYEGGLDADGRPADTRTNAQKRVLYQIIMDFICPDISDNRSLEQRNFLMKLILRKLKDLMICIMQKIFL